MKYILLSAFLITFSIAADGQTGRYKSDLYRLGLNKLVEQVDSFYAKSFAETDWRVVYLNSKEFFDHPDSINGRQIVDVGKDNWHQHYATHDNRIFQVTVIEPLYESDKAVLNFHVVDTKYNGEGAEILATVAWTRVIFRMDCESKGWTYERTVTESPDPLSRKR